MNNDVIVLPDAPEFLAATLAGGGAIAWEQGVTITTYEPAEADRYPMFLDRRVYQGSSGRVYPIPFTDAISTDATRREWTAVHLENKWIRLMVLPELGGRIHIGYDKVARYDFFYRNNVIKPALVGLAGPWISGGVEFNWPQHHRPATYLPVDFEIEHGADGSVTVWCSDHDPFTRMKGMHGVRLHPDRAVVELVARLHNRTSEPQTFLWWANVAARVHDEYQSFFPTDVRYVADHARRAITAFPHADRPYYGFNYPAEADTGGDRLDFYKNIPVPTSYMILDTEDDFFGGYDHAAGAGFVHVADRHVAPGKKQWTWGNAAFGHAWDDLLTDSDGPYIELMAGVYTDNQPDFAWLQPGETKTFTQSWFPIQKIGVVHQATTEVAVHLDVADGIANIGVCVTSARTGVKIRLTSGGRAVYAWDGDLEPGSAHIARQDVGSAANTALELTVFDDGVELLRWRPRGDATRSEPEIATEPPLPSAIGSLDELYFTGVHLAQYRHPTRSPVPYWEEALRRDALDSRSNLAMGEDALRRGLYEKAETHVRAALQRIAARNGNPKDGEASYLLGLILTRTQRCDAAIDAFAKAAWDVRWAGPSFVEISRLHAHGRRWAESLDYAQRAKRAVPDDYRARIVEIVALRHLEREAEAVQALSDVLRVDPLDQTARALAGRTLSSDPRTLIDVAGDLARAGDSDGALRALGKAESMRPTGSGEVRPIANYHRAALLDELGRHDEAAEARRNARMAETTRCFPAGLDDHDALVRSLAAEPEDSTAMSLLAMLFVDSKRHDEALALWVRVINMNQADAVTLRNAAITVFNLDGDGERASTWYEQAIALRPRDARLWYESDQLLARRGVNSADRLSRLEDQSSIVMTRDDATIELCELLTAEGRAPDAIAIMTTKKFAPWEGGEGKTLQAWENAHVAAATAAEDNHAALRLIEAALTPPPNLGESRHLLAPIGRLLLLRADRLEALGNAEGAAADRARAAAEPPDTPVLPGAPVDYFATSLPELLLFDPPTRDELD